MTPLEAITHLIEGKKTAKKIPHCAEFRAVKDLVQLQDDELWKELNLLKSEGVISIKESINSHTFLFIE